MRSRTSSCARTAVFGRIVASWHCARGSTGSPTTAASTSCAVRMPVAIETIDALVPSVQDPVTKVEQRDALRRLIADVQRLPDQQRSALLMRELSGMAYIDVAAALGVSVPAVKSLLVRARIGFAQANEARDTACAAIREDLIAPTIAACAPRASRDDTCATVPNAAISVPRCAGSAAQFAALAPTLGPLRRDRESARLGQRRRAGASSGATAGGGAAAAAARPVSGAASRRPAGRRRRPRRHAAGRGRGDSGRRGRDSSTRSRPRRRTTPSHRAAAAAPAHRAATHHTARSTSAPTAARKHAVKRNAKTRSTTPVARRPPPRLRRRTRAAPTAPHAANATATRAARATRCRSPRRMDPDNLIYAPKPQGRTRDLRDRRRDHWRTSATATLHRQPGDQHRRSTPGTASATATPTGTASGAPTAAPR